MTEKKMKQAKISSNSKGIWFGFLATFAAGLICSQVFDNAPRVKKMGMSQDVCQSIASRIAGIARGGFGESIIDSYTEQLKQLNEIYVANCRDMRIEIPKPLSKKEQLAKQKADAEYDEKLRAIDTLPERTCEAIEKVLSDQLSTSRSCDHYCYLQNSNIYKNMITYGCPENADEHKRMLLRSVDMAAALMRGYGDFGPVCEVAKTYIDFGENEKALSFLKTYEETGLVSDEFQERCFGNDRRIKGD